MMHTNFFVFHKKIDIFDVHIVEIENLGQMFFRGSLYL